MNMLSPKKTKYRKQFKGRIHGNSKGNYALNYGSYGLKAIEPERITSRQIESARKAITRYLKRAGLDYWPYIDLCLHSNFEDFLQTNQNRRIIGFSKIEIFAICDNDICKILFILSTLVFFNFHGSSSFIYLFVKKLILITFFM